MTTVRRITVSQINGEDANNNNTDEIRPFGETSFSLDTSGEGNRLTLMMFDGQRTHIKSKVLSPGMLYGSNADSGDGNGTDTIKLIPDATLFDQGSDQYIIIDPTIGEPGHIHLRAGGTQDSSSADLYLGGEQTFVRISDTYDNVTIRTTGAETNNWVFGLDGNLTLPSDIASINYANGIPYAGSSYSNANVVAYSEAGWAGNIIPAANATYTLGNITNQWANLWVANNTIYIGNIAIGVNDANVLTVNGQPTLSNNSSTSINTDGNITAGNLNAYRITGSYGNIANVVGVESLEFTDGSEIDGITGNASLGNITASGNITGNYFVGNGSLLTGITAGTNYTNSNVVNLLSNFGSNTITTTGNVTAGNILSSGNIVFTNNASGIKFNNTATIYSDSGSLGRTGSIVLQPFTGAGSVFPGVVIGGAGRLIAPNGSVHQIFNNDDVTFQVAVKATVPTAATSTTTGALQVTGGVGVGGNIYVGGNATTGINSIVAGISNTLLPNTVASFSANVNNYTQVTLQNKNTGADATADFIITADNGSDTVNFADFGIINSGYDNATPTNSLGNIVHAADTYLYAQGNSSAVSQSGGNLAIGTTVTGKTVKIFAGGANANSVIATVSNTGVVVNGNLTATNLSGNISITGNVTGTSSNVELVAGAYTWTFNNTGNLVLPGNTFAVNYANGTAVTLDTFYLLEAYASETYTLPGSFTEDVCRYSYISNTVNVPSAWFNTSTYRFTPLKAGYWDITAAYDVYRNTESSMVIKKNTTIVASAGSFNAVAQQITKIIYLNGSTDYIQIFNTGGAAMSRSQYESRSWFQARWIGE